MKIVNCGYDFRHSENFKINRPFGSGDFILLILRSPAQFFLRGETYICNSNSVIIFSKGTPQIYGALDCEYINDWVHFEAEDTDIEWMKSLGLRFDTLMDLHQVSMFSDLIRTMFEEYYSQNKNSYETAFAYFKILLMKISDSLDENKYVCDTKIYKSIKKVREDIYSNPSNDWSAEKIAAEFSVSCSYFQHLYKKFFNHSLKKDVTLARLQYAKYLLFATDYKVSAISKTCGYQNDVHFMRIFKTQTGMTPTEYRKNSIYSDDKVLHSMKFNPYNLG